jgi:hypothetical protein
MLTGTQDVRFWGKTGCERRSVKTALFTLSCRLAGSTFTSAAGGRPDWVREIRYYRVCLIALGA